jgi:hypothetical protein
MGDSACKFSGVAAPSAEAAAGAATGRPDAVRTDLAMQLSPEAKDADFDAMIVANPETTLRAVG